MVITGGWHLVYGIGQRSKGGLLGRHPRLGTELPGIYRPDDVMRTVDRKLDHYQDECLGGERFGEILERTGIIDLSNQV